MTEQTVWLIHPRDPLIARDGKPFGPNPGARAQPLSFPFPSTTTGGARARIWQHSGGSFDKAQFTRSSIEEIRKIEVVGPLLVSLQEDTTNSATASFRWMVPAPADALLLAIENDVNRSYRHQLHPLQLPTDAVTDLQKRSTVGTAVNSSQELQPVGMTHYDPRKVASTAPRYWYWAAFEEWLLQPTSGEITLHTLGHDGPVSEQRMHLRVQADTKTADEGFLFQTNGLEFIRTRDRQQLLERI